MTLPGPRGAIPPLVGRARDAGAGGGQLLCLPEGVGQLASLESLRLNDNRLALLPAALARLTRLAALSVIDNRLRRIHPALAALTRLAYLDVNNNPDLLCPPQRPPPPPSPVPPARGLCVLGCLWTRSSAVCREP